MARHRREAGVDLPRLAASRSCRPRSSCCRRSRAAARRPAPGTPGQGIEQHLVGLQRIGPHDEGPAVRQLGMRTCSLVRSPR
jgi:hypothetical protein